MFAMIFYQHNWHCKKLYIIPKALSLISSCFWYTIDNWNIFVVTFNMSTNCRSTEIQVLLACCSNRYETDTPWSNALTSVEIKHFLSVGSELFGFSLENSSL